MMKAHKLANAKRSTIKAVDNDKTKKSVKTTVEDSAQSTVTSLKPKSKMVPKSEPNQDAELVARVQAGDKSAFDVLVRKYQQRIMNLISRFIKDSSEVQDVSQEAFIKAYRALPGFRGDSAFYTWLYRIAINTAKNYLVSRGRRPPGTDIDAIDAEQYNGGDALRDTGSPERLMFRDEIRDLIFATIDELPEDLKTAITLREMDGLSYEEISETMDCPVGTVRSRIFRARDAIDQKIAPLLEKNWRS